MFMPMIQKRRSIRKFLNRQVEPEKIDVLIEAALRAPSSMGKNPWEFIVVKEPKLLEKISRAKQGGSAFIKNAPLCIVVFADPERSDVWVEDASIAATFVLLAAESMGLGACWVQIRNRMHNPEITSQAYLSKLLNIPENMMIESIIATGYPDETKTPHGKEELQYGKVFLDAYGNEFKN